MAEDLRTRILQTTWRLTYPHSFYDAVQGDSIVQALAGEFPEAEIRGAILKLYWARDLITKGGGGNQKYGEWHYQLAPGLCVCGELFNEAGLREHQKECVVYQACLEQIRNPTCKAPRPAVEQAIEQAEAAAPVAPIAPHADAPAVSRHLLKPVEQHVLEIAFEHPAGIDREELVIAAHARKPSVSLAVVRTEVARLVKRGALLNNSGELLTISPHWCTCGRDYRDGATLERHRAACTAWNRLGLTHK